MLLRGLRLAEQGDWQSSGSLLEQAVRQAEADGQPEICSPAAAHLGLQELKRGHLSQALHWLGRAQILADSPRDTAYLALLLALTQLGEAQAAAEQAERELVRGQQRLAQEIQRLQAESQAVAARLLLEVEATLSRGPNANLPLPPASSPAAPIRAAPAPQLTVRLLGQFEARLPDGRALQLCSSRKGQALFRVLATQPHVRQHRESLLLLFWPDEAPATAAGKLHIAASRLRKALAGAGLGPDVLVFEDDGYWLNRELGVESDVARFDAHNRAGKRLDLLHEADLALGEYEAGLALYRGAYLAEEIGVDWPLAERTRLEDQYLTLLTRLVDGYFDRQAYVKCAECCRRLLQIDSLREDIYRQQMRCLSRVGQRSQALHQYQVCAGTLRQELGLEPMRETQVLAQQIRDEQSV